MFFVPCTVIQSHNVDQQNALSLNLDEDQNEFNVGAFCWSTLRDSYLTHSLPAI